MKNIWLDRTLMTSAYYIGLCTTEEMYHRALRHLKVPREDWPSFKVTKQSNAACHFFERPDGKRVAIVCMVDDPKYTGVRKAAMLVHEAVHIWQAHRDDIGEKNPASEQEAYAIQHISQTLMTAFAEQTKNED